MIILSMLANSLRRRCPSANSNQYSLGYTPDKAVTGAGYRKLTLTTKQIELIVQTRDGYYGE